MIKTYPLLQSQLGIFLEWAANPQITQYNLPGVFKLPKTVTAKRIADVIDKLTLARPEMKMRFVLEDGEPRQYIDESMQIKLKVMHLSEDDAQQYLSQIVKPYDLLKGEPLWRFEFIETQTYNYFFQEGHHSIVDGLSLAPVFTTEFSALYSGEELELGNTYNILKHAETEFEQMSTDQYQRAKGYYMERFEDTSLLTLSTKGAQDSRGNSIRHSAYISTKDVDSWCADNKCSASFLFMAAFSYTLSILSRQDKVAYSSVNHGRNDKRLRSAYGMFVKSTATLVEVDRTEKVLKFINGFRRELMNSVRYGIYPFNHFCRDLKQKMAISFGFQGAGMQEFILFDGVPHMGVQMAKGLTSSDLNVVIYIRDNQYDIRIEASDKLYDQQYLVKVAEAIKNTVLNMMSNPDAQLGEIMITSAEEQQQIIKLSKGKDLQYNQNETFVDMVVGHSINTPNAVAIVDSESQLTYSELNLRSDILAGELIDRGVKPNQFVALMLPRCKEFPLSIISVQKAGAAYLPLDDDYPNDRLLYMLEDSEAEMLITTREILQQKQCEGEFAVKNVIFIDELIFDGMHPDAINKTSVDSLAYMIYTSGSTGKPKGTMLSHRALRAFVAWRIAEIGITPDSRHAVHASFSFDASLDDLLSPLAAGGSIYIMPPCVRKDLDAIHSYLNDNQITGLTMSTAMGMTLMNQFSDLAVKFIMMGGEKMLPFPKTSIKVINGYGPTEFTVCSSFHIVDQDKDQDIPIGRAVPNSYSFICDKYGNLMPMGFSGEICLVGAQIANGYWKQEGMTAEKFTNTPFIDGAKMYHTGDLARYNEDGELEFMGRIDNQVKLRGFRIEMGEIENAAALYQGVRAVAAQVKQIGSDKHLCLYYTADREIGKTDLQEKLSTTLAEYMVPTIYIQMEELPLTPNGKVNREALPEPTIERTVEFVAPQGEVESKIAEAFAQVLSTEPIGALDNFLALGGDSIKSIRLVSILRSMGVELQVSDVLQHKSVRAIASVAKLTDSESIISQETLIGAIDPSAIQQFFIDMRLPVAEHFNQSVALRALSPINISTIKRALEAIVIHHDMLRAIVKDGSVYVRDTENEGDLFAIEEVDLSSENLDVNSQISSYADAVQGSMDIAQGPLFKVLVIHLSNNEDILLLFAHHLTVDGVSWRIILDDLNNAYHQIGSTDSVTLPAKTESFARYTELLSDYSDSYLLSMERGYWMDIQERMGGYAQSNGFDYNRKFEKQTILSNEQFISQLLTNSSKVYNTDINDLLLTSLCRSYHQLTGVDALSVQMEGHGRENIGKPLAIDRTVGWFTTTYPILFDGLTGDVRADIIGVKETLRRVPNKGIGYTTLQYIASNGGEESLRRDITPLIGFNYLGELDETSSEALFVMDSSIPTGRMLSEKNNFGPSLMINSVVVSGEFSAIFDYDSSLWSDEQISKLKELFIEQLRVITDHIATAKGGEETASDIGATWSEQEYAKITANYAERGEKIELVYPMSPMQEGMLLKYQMDPTSTAYRLITRFALNILPTEQQLRYALNIVSAKHEVLRSSLIYRGVTEPCQAIIKRELGLRVVDVSDAADIDAAIENIHQQELSRGFDLQYDPLMRIVCIKRQDSACELLFALHHVVVDGWCIPIYMADFLQALSDAINNEMQIVTESAPTGRYGKFIENLLRLDKREALAYWKDLLKGYDTKAIIPTYGEVVDESEKGKDSISVALSADEERQLNHLCTTKHVTPNTIIELAWALLLQKYNRVNDVVFGKVVSGRDNTVDDVNDLVGIFINTIPVRIQIDPKQSVEEALNQIQLNDAKSNKYDFCALSEVQQQSEIGQDLFQSILVFENYPSDNELFKRLPFTVKPTYVKEESFVEISLTAYTSGDGRLILEVKYDNQIYSAAKANQVLNSLLNIVRGIMSDVTAAALSLPLLAEVDLGELMELSKGPDLEFDTDATFVSLFVEQAKATPDALATADESSQYSYAELDRYSNSLAHILKEYGIEENSFVCVMLDRCNDFPLSVLAIQKIGAAYTPLDLEYPNERLSYMIEDSESKVIVTTHRVLEQKMAEGDLLLGDAQIIYIDDLDLTSKREPINLAKPENLCYMIYTSGSTGLPKGVVLHHRGLRSYIASMINVLELSIEDRISNHRPFSFDAHIQDLYPVLTIGGSIHIMPTSIRRDMKGLRDFIVEHKVTGGSYTTSLGAMLLEAYELPLRYLTCTGEKMIALVSGDVQIYNGYGPTECTDLISAYKLEKGRVYKDIPIGRPMANSHCFIVDQGGSLLPIGVAGELCFASVQVGRGYWKLPEKSAEVFCDSPFLPNDANGNPIRMYHTGDLCRWNAEGEIEYLGRIDSQVKLRGFRIELGEIETQAKKVESINQAVAMVRDLAGAQHLVLYYTVKEGMSVTEDEMRNFLVSTKLAEYMIPEIYMELTEFSYNSSGKVNRKMLPEPELKVEDIILPETDLERELYKLASETLKHSKFGVTTNLITVGMTSLSAMRLTAIIQQKMQIEINTKDLLTTPTLREIANKMEQGEIKRVVSVRLTTPVSIESGVEPKAAGNNPFKKRQVGGGSNPFKKRQEDSNPLKKAPTGNPFKKRD